MIKPNELRLGNIILYKGEQIKVTMIGEFGIQSTENGRTINAKFSTPDLEGIEITQNWFNYFTFTKSRYNGYEIFGIKISFEFDIQLDRFIYYYIIRDDGYEFTKTEIKYVHKLQNLIFELTGMDLT